MTVAGTPNFDQKNGAVGDVVAETTHPDVFYETKLFRVRVARRAMSDGHVIIERKEPKPHLYSFSPDDVDEFGYLLKKVSFWVMRLTGATGFTVLMNDGTDDALEDDDAYLRVHIIPRGIGDNRFSHVTHSIKELRRELEDGTVYQVVAELRDLMQLPQD